MRKRDKVKQKVRSDRRTKREKEGLGLELGRYGKGRGHPFLGLVWPKGFYSCPPPSHFPPPITPYLLLLLVSFSLFSLATDDGFNV